MIAVMYGLEMSTEPGAIQTLLEQVVGDYVARCGFGQKALVISTVAQALAL